MRQPDSLLYSLGALQFACGLLCGIGWYFGMRIERLLPALLAGGVLALTVQLGPGATRILASGGSLEAFPQRKLSFGSTRPLTFLAMLGVLGIFAILHRYWPQLTAAPEEAERLSVQVRRWLRQGMR